MRDRDGPSGPRLETGVKNLDVLFGGGIPKGTAVVVAGPPGAGKTILAQQICFHNATSTFRVLYFTTLTEPVAKTLRFMSQFSFFTEEKLAHGIEFVDLGLLLRSERLADAARLILGHVERVKPAMVVIDSFKVFDDLATSRDELRKFTYELAVNLMAWESTTLLLGEYSSDELQRSPLSSIVDSVILVTQRERSAEQQRFIQIPKMRGTAHSLDEHSFLISSDGVSIFAPRVTIERTDSGSDEQRCKTGISKLDDLLAEGISRGSSILVAGVAGTGKTVLLLEFIYRGAVAGEKGIFFSFEETAERLCEAARGLGWDLDREIKRGMIELVFIAQPNIMTERHLLTMRERICAMGARRVVIDSVSVFLHKITDPQACREKVFQIATIIQNVGAVGLLATDVPYGATQLSRFGVEETVVDGIFLLSATEEGLERHRYLEVYKLRGTAHLKGRHNMLIGDGGIKVFPRYSDAAGNAMTGAFDARRRQCTGVPGLDELLHGGLLERSVTLISGSAGIGKSTMGLQFILEGRRHEQPGLYVSVEEGPAQILESAEALRLPLQEAIGAGLAEVVFLPRAHRAHELLALLTDKIVAQGSRRVVLDSVSQIANELGPAELRELLAALAARFKSLGVTSLLTLESQSLFAADGITDRGFSPVVDNVILVRYTHGLDELRPTLVVVKTRGSAHDWGAHYFSITDGGVRITRRADSPREARPRLRLRSRSDVARRR